MWVFLVLAALGVAALIYWAGRYAELFLIRVDQGKPRLVRGRIPPRLLSDISEVVRRAKIDSAKIRVLSERGEPQLVAPGLGEGTCQQLRNVVGAYKVAQIRAGAKPQR
jgi:hypothetical protein